MRIALLGYGKMGREIEAAAREQGDTITEVFDIDRLPDPDALRSVDVCIEFSTPQTVVDNIRVALQARKDIVVGTTGWHDRVAEIRREVKETGLIYSSNFSLGVNIYFRIVAAAAEIMRNSTDYDPFIHEVHHRQKADSPSGTALHLAEILMKRIDRKKELVTNRMDGKIDREALHVSSTRVGTVAGTHTVGFDSEADSIEITHVAKNRHGFALGALRAAHWIHGKKGVYTMDDVDL
jgi:4-hydroxy-tetrahydrodipicolinate reductase